MLRPITMTPNFQTQHATMLFKYAGISFISGAVNHGFFSGERSLWTGGIGIVLFVLGAVWEHHQTMATTETPPKLGQGPALGYAAVHWAGVFYRRVTTLS